MSSWNRYEWGKKPKFKFKKKEYKVKQLIWLQQRYKALISLLGGLLGYLYAVQMSNPNHYVLLAIAVLTTLGVHQARNQDPK